MGWFDWLPWVNSDSERSETTIDLGNIGNNQVIVNVRGADSDNSRAIDFAVNNNMHTLNIADVNSFAININGRQINITNTNRSNESLEDAIVSHLDSAGIDAQEHVERQATIPTTGNLIADISLDHVTETMGNPVTATTGMSEIRIQQTREV